MNKQYFPIVGACLLFILLPLLQMKAADVYVDASSTCTSGCGLNWGTGNNGAYPDLQDALTFAKNNGHAVIRIAQGTYKPSTSDRSAYFDFSGLAVYGGYQGGSANPSFRSPQSFITILSGDIGTVGSKSDNSYTVVYTFTPAFGSSTVNVDGVMIISGNADNTASGFSEHKLGGGWYNYLNYNGTSSITMKDVIFQGNEAVEGGGFYSNKFIIGSIIFNMDGCTFQSNHATDFGGGMYINSHTIETTLSIEKCTFSGNTTNETGAGAYVFVKDAEYNGNIQNTIFTGNVASNTTAKKASAGAFYNLCEEDGECSTIMNNCVIVGNAAEVGGGFYINGSNGGINSAIVTNTIFWNNIAVDEFPNINMSGGSDPTMEMKYCIVQASSCANIYPPPSSFPAPDGDFDCSDSGEGMIFNLDPQFVSASDFHISPSSPAGNSGDNTMVPGSSTDIDGEPRIQQAVVDIGVDESVSAILPITLTNFNAFLIDDAVHLKWTTETETNNDFFTIERSKDGRNFEVLETVDGAGNSQVQNSYLAIDKNPLSGLSYYRLRQTDFDGKFAFGGIRSVFIDGKTRFQGEVKLYPNPVGELVNYYNDGLTDGERSYTIFNVTGQTVQEGNMVFNNHLSSLALKRELQKHQGIYFLKVEGSDQVLRFVTTTNK